jgi:sec-independent protein translocase protein TatC
MKKPVHSSTPTMMIHHVKEIQVRLLITVAVLIAGMALGYVFYEQLFHFIKAPLGGPLHYTSPAGSFSFVVKICLMVGVIVALPVAVYNAIMFVQPALKQRLSRIRVYTTTLLSLVFAALGASFAFLVIIPLALRFFYKFQVDGLIALISADDYLKFVVNVILAFVIIFQLPLLISLIDHIRPLPPMKLLKAEKYVIVGSLVIALVVPFAVDPMVQLLIASPIIVLYNLSILVVVIQRALRRRKTRPEQTPEAFHSSAGVPVAQRRASPQPAMAPPPLRRSVGQTPPAVHKAARPPRQQPLIRSAPRPARTRLITDIRRPVRSPPVVVSKLTTDG